MLCYDCSYNYCRKNWNIAQSSIVTASDLGQGLADMLFGLEFKIGRQDTVYSVVHIGSVNQSLSLFTPIHRCPALFSICHIRKLMLQKSPYRTLPHCHCHFARKDENLLEVINLYTASKKLTYLWGEKDVFIEANDYKIHISYTQRLHCFMKWILIARTQDWLRLYSKFNVG